MDFKQLAITIVSSVIASNVAILLSHLLRSVFQRDHLKEMKKQTALLKEVVDIHKPIG